MLSIEYAVPKEVLIGLGKTVHRRMFSSWFNRKPIALAVSICFGFAIGCLYWFADVWLHVWFRRYGTFSQELFHASTLDLVPRAIVSLCAMALIWALLRLVYKERVLSEREARVRLLLESTGEGVIGVDRNGVCTFTNPESLALLGYANGSAIEGKKMHSMLHYAHSDGSLYPESQCKAQLALSRGKTAFVDDEVFWRADGTSLEVEYNVHPVNRNGVPDGGVYVFSDISKRKRREREFKAYAEKLAEANRTKDLFTDILRHDLLNPATAVRAAAQHLSHLETDAKKKVLVGAILQSIERLIDVCDRAARYAKVAGSEKIGVSSHDLRGLVTAVVRDFRPQLEQKKIELRFEPSPIPAIAEVNLLISDVFSNLISNAIKYSPPASVIEVQLCDEGAVWAFAVKDRGEGIPDAAKGAVFSRFERLGKQGIKGTGLGLAIVKHIVELHHGRVWIEDNKGGGSVFRVCIPKHASRDVMAGKVA